jgi:hypothetical protein
LLTQEPKLLPVLAPFLLKGVLPTLSGKVEAGFTPKFENEPINSMDELPEPVRMEGRQYFCKIRDPKTTQINPMKNTR